MSAKVTQEINSDWFGFPLDPPVQYSLSCDDNGLLFQASHKAPAQLKPTSEEGKFCAELWRFDVAELFIADPIGGTYWEVNLAPNGAWWMCQFRDVRLAHEKQPDFAGVKAEGKCHRDSWNARIRIPKDLFPPLDTLSYNITFILNSPAQTFHSLAKLPGEEPDFHQPDSFLPLASRVPS